MPRRRAAPLYPLRISQLQHNTEIKERIDTAPPKMGAPQLCTALAAPILSGSFLSSIAWRRVARLRLAPILARCRLDASFSAGLGLCRRRLDAGYLTGGFCVPRPSPLPLACARPASVRAPVTLQHISGRSNMRALSSGSGGAPSCPAVLTTYTPAACWRQAYSRRPCTMAALSPHLLLCFAEW